MTKRSMTLATLAIAAVAAMAIWARYMTHPPIPSREDLWIPQNAVVLDSAQIPGSEKAFVFQYDVGALGYSTAMVSLRKPTHLAPFLLLEGSPTHVWWTAPDTLMVEVQSDSNQLFTPPTGIVVVPTHVTKPVR
jgi:hypothetical protein